MANRISALQTFQSPGIIQPQQGAMTRRNQGNGANAAAVVRVNAADCTVDRASWASMKERVEMLAAMMGPAGPQAGGYDWNAGLSAQYTGTDPYNGGTLPTEMVVIPDNAAANTVWNIPFGADNSQRYQGTMMLRVWSQITPTTANGGALLNNAGLCTITAFLNGMPLPQMNAIPLASITPNLIGTPQAWQIPWYIKPASGLRFELRVNQTLLGIAGQTSGIQIIGEFGVPAGQQAARISQIAG